MSEDTEVLSALHHGQMAERINGTGHLFAVATSISRQRKFAVVQINYLYTNDVYLF